MAWNIIRKATDEDRELLNRRAESFIKRHNLDIADYLIENSPGIHHALCDYLIGHSDFGTLQQRDRGVYLQRLYKRVVRRALDHPQADGIAMGYVGYYID